MTLDLKQFRRKHRMSRERLADLLGVSLSTVTRIEKKEHNGERIPERYRLAVEALERKMSHRRDLRTPLTAHEEPR